MILLPEKCKIETPPVKQEKKWVSSVTINRMPQKETRDYERDNRHAIPNSSLPPAYSFLLYFWCVLEDGSWKNFFPFWKCSRIHEEFLITFPAPLFIFSFSFQELVRIKTELLGLINPRTRNPGNRREPSLCRTKRAWDPWQVSSVQHERCNDFLTVSSKAHAISGWRNVTAVSTTLRSRESSFLVVSALLHYRQDSACSS